MFLDKQQKYRDIVTGCVLLLLSAALFWASQNIRDFASIGVGANFLPLLTAWLFLILGLAIVIASFRKTKPVKSGNDTSIGQEEAGEDAVFGGLPSVFLSIFLMVIYFLCLEKVGFLVSTLVYVFLQIQILEKDKKRNHRLFFATTLIAVVLLYFLFANVFDISLPSGILG
ncbi:tripartite tricarboxylate transporter TctB family protein [Halomonas sp. SpR1]|uniref:tripartite tricarboxylate transporter TctB family protein n=1 Tax=Halomonas sp. SpR1 TaxID=3050462 RepID=UPI0027E5A8BA|nr:tripartite tricarboxylate transporter TctB family protein [Halomonas sp. SpR1]MDQ7734704.1 tripartite tricarboxylate transporter TctB family protein [Halomonas sp. SpR1]